MFEEIKTRLKEAKRDFEDKCLAYQKIFAQDYVNDIKKYNDDPEQLLYITDSYVMDVTDYITEIKDIEKLLSDISNFEKNFNSFIEDKRDFYLSNGFLIQEIMK